MACTSVGGRGLAHHGMLRPATTDVADILASLAAERLTRGEPVLVVVPATAAERLRALLPTLDRLHTTDPSEFYRRPGRVLGHYRDWIADASPDGRPATIVAALDPRGQDAHQAALWMHIDSITTLALSECGVTLICVYPNDPVTIGAVRAAHPTMINGAVAASPDHLPSEQFVARYPLPPPADLGEPAFTHIIDRPTQLHGLRRAVAAYAVGAGIPAARCADFVLAVIEVATNALDHGEPPAVVRLWATLTSVICQVTDNGRFTQPLAGLCPPPVAQRRGRGLWMVHQLCDQFYLWPHPTTIRLQMNRIQAVSP